MTKSSDSRSISAGIARRAISRPGLPKMSPMKRMRMLRANRNPDFLAAPLVEARQRDAQLARDERRAGAPRIERAVEMHRTREAAERALRKMERRFRVLARGRHLLARDHEDVAHVHDLDRLERYARHVKPDLHARFGLDHVKGGTAFRCRDWAFWGRTLPHQVEQLLEILR